MDYPQPHRLLRRIVLWVATAMFAGLFALMIAKQYIRRPIANSLAAVGDTAWYIRSTRLVSDSYPAATYGESDETVIYRRQPDGAWEERLSLGTRSFGACAYKEQLVVAQPARMVWIDGDNVRLRRFDEFNIGGIAAGAEALYVTGFLGGGVIGLARTDGDTVERLSNMEIAGLPGAPVASAGLCALYYEGAVAVFWFQERADDAGAPVVAVYSAWHTGGEGWSDPEAVVVMDTTGVTYSAALSPQGVPALGWARFGENTIHLLEYDDGRWHDAWSSPAGTVRSLMGFLSPWDIALTTYDDSLRLAVIAGSVQEYAALENRWRHKGTILPANPSDQAFGTLYLFSLVASGLLVTLGLVSLTLRLVNYRKKPWRGEGLGQSGAPNGDDAGDSGR